MRLSSALVIALSAMSMPSSAQSDVTQGSETKQITSVEYQYDKAFMSPRRAPLLDKQMIVTDTHSQVTDWSAKNQSLQALKFESKQRSSNLTIVNNDFWIYDSWATLSKDFDYDGYYSNLTVEFDADTVYNRAYVYAVIYLGIGDVFESIHVSSVFAIDADSSNDSFVVESELISGFPSNDYEIMIELYDADTDEFVAFSDGFDDADLAFVPLESANYDVVSEPTVVIVEEHGGSLSYLGLLMTTLLLALRRKINLRSE